MGRRSAVQTSLEILVAFEEQQTWKQAELARRLHVSVDTVREHLLHFVEAGVPLHTEHDHPHVYWSLAGNWFPAGLRFTHGDAASLVRLLRQVPASKERTRVLFKIAQALPQDDSLSRTPTTLMVPTLSENEEVYRNLVADAAESRTALRMQYRSESRGALEWRHVSVQRVMFDVPGRFVAVCHKSDKLKWFRIGRISTGKLDSAEPFRPSAPADIDRYIEESPDHFHGASLVESRFTVRDPEARWVAESLPEGLSYVRQVAGIEVHCASGAVEPIARFVVGLGDAAHATTPELAAEVQRLANAIVAKYASKSGRG